MNVARVRMFFSFRHEGVLHECAAVHWFWMTDDFPDEDTGMWVVAPGRHRDPSGQTRKHVAFITVINIRDILRAAHLVGVITNREVSAKMSSYESLDTYKASFVNKYIDHHAFDLLHPRPPMSSDST